MRKKKETLIEQALRRTKLIGRELEKRRIPSKEERLERLIFKEKIIDNSPDHILHHQLNRALARKEFQLARYIERVVKSRGIELVTIYN